MQGHGTHTVPPFKFRGEYWSQQALPIHQQSHNQQHETVQQDNHRHCKKTQSHNSRRSTQILQTLL